MARDQEDQMDYGSMGAMRGQSHVRIPQRRINRSLRTGVSPSMQMQNSQGHFQGTPYRQAQPFRPSGPQKSDMFHRFMNRTLGPKTHTNNGLHLGQLKQQFQNGGRPSMYHPPIFKSGGGPNGGQKFPFGPTPYHQEQPPMGGVHMPGAPGQQFPFPGAPNGVPIHPIGSPIIGNLQQHPAGMHGMIQAIMGDLAQGINPDQFANMQAGKLPGGEQGDFLRALGGGDLNNSPLQALVQHLTQGAAGADGTPGNYMVNQGQGGDIIQLLRQAIMHNPNLNPPPRPPGLRFPLPPRNPLMPGRGGVMPLNTTGGIPQAGYPR